MKTADDLIDDILRAAFKLKEGNIACDMPLMNDQLMIIEDNADKLRCLMEETDEG